MLLPLIYALFDLVYFACSRGVPPTIVQPSMASAVALLGQDVDFTCIVNDLGSHMVAFVRSDTPPRLLTFDEKVFRRREKYELKARVGDEQNEWVLTIKNVQEADRGNYSCQINTEPVTIASGELDVKVPPMVSRSTPAAVEVREGNNVTLTCKAEGNPPPSVIWRRQDRQIIRYNGATGFGASVFHGPALHLTKVSRKHMSEYICVASNGIPPDESWTVKLLVTFAPFVQAQAPAVQASLGAMARLVCTTEAWPRPDVVWEKNGEHLFDSDEYATSHSVSGQYHSVHILEIRAVQPHHYGTYRCLARNDNGLHHAETELTQIVPEPNGSQQQLQQYLYTNALPEGSGAGSNVDDEADDVPTSSDEQQPENLPRRSTQLADGLDHAAASNKAPFRKHVAVERTPTAQQQQQRQQHTELRARESSTSSAYAGFSILTFTLFSALIT